MVLTALPNILCLVGICGISLAQNESVAAPFSLPTSSNNSAARAAQIAANRAGILYGVSPLVPNLTYFPTGPLGDLIVQQEVSELDAQAYALGPLLGIDAKLAEEAAREAGGINGLADYEILYNSQWLYTNPTGVNPGFFTNYTQDLYFSMERLSVNPFPLSRLAPNQSLPFTVSDDIVRKLSNQTLDQLHTGGRLFLVDHSVLATYPVGAGKYSSACSAYFYLHPSNNEFLPLAIKTYNGANLTYTPLDTPNDWLLAKTLFESNENLYLASYHWAVTHATAEIVHEAALRTLANEHPIRGLLDRIMYRAYAVNVLGAQTLFGPNGSLDQSFAYGSQGFANYTTYLYFNGAGAFQANYLDSALVARGLLNSTFGPPLPTFPYYEDASELYAVIKTFVTTFVTAYYSSDSAVASDSEVQAWAAEANGPAKVIDFPPAPLSDRDTIIDILTQMFYLTGVLHHELNTGSLFASWSLPLHPTAHWAPLPTSKNISSVMTYMPDIEQSLAQINTEAEFGQPNLVYENGTLATSFADQNFLAATTDEVREAAQNFTLEMNSIGARISARTFDENGLSQGMPFVWQNLNPLRIPFFLAI